MSIWPQSVCAQCSLISEHYIHSIVYCDNYGYCESVKKHCELLTQFLGPISNPCHELPSADASISTQSTYALWVVLEIDVEQFWARML